MGKWELIPGSRSLRVRLEDREFRHAYDQLAVRFDVARELVNLRHSRGLTQQELAKRLGTRQSRVSKIESAEHDSKLGTIFEIANALGADVRISIVPREAEARVVETVRPADLSIFGDMQGAVSIPWEIHAQPKAQIGMRVRRSTAWNGLALAHEEPERVGAAA